MEDGESAEQLAALQYGGGINHSTRDESIEDLQTIANCGNFRAKKITHYGLALTQRGDVAETAQDDVNKDVKDAKARHLQIGFTHLPTHHMERRQTIKECEKNNGRSAS